MISGLITDSSQAENIEHGLILSGSFSALLERASAEVSRSVLPGQGLKTTCWDYIHRKHWKQPDLHMGRADETSLHVETSISEEQEAVSLELSLAERTQITPVYVSASSLWMKASPHSWGSFMCGCKPYFRHCDVGPSALLTVGTSNQTLKALLGQARCILQTCGEEEGNVLTWVSVE